MGGLRGLEALKRLLYHPTCNICGLDSGYRGPGPKTVLPSSAKVKVDFRLVYDQDPDYLFVKLKKHLKEHGFTDVEVIKLSSLESSKTLPTASVAQAVIRAARVAFKKNLGYIP